MLVRYLLQIILALILMFWLSARLTAVLLSVVPLIAIGAVQYGEYYVSTLVMREYIYPKCSVLKVTSNM